MIAKALRQKLSDNGKRGGTASGKINHELKLKRIEGFNKNPKRCKRCNIPLSYNKRYNDFCSHNCAAKFNCLGGITRGVSRDRICPICKKTMSPDSNMCLSCKRTDNEKLLEKHISSENICIKSTSLRPYYIKLRGHKCERCGNTKWNDDVIPLHAHHVDGDTYNNIGNNILLLCPNCHAQTSNYCSKNRGNGKFKIIRVPKSSKGV